MYTIGTTIKFSDHPNKNPPAKMFDSSSQKKSAKGIFEKSSIHLREKKKNAIFTYHFLGVHNETTTFFSPSFTNILPYFSTPRGWAKSSCGCGVLFREWQWRYLAVVRVTPGRPPGRPSGRSSLTFFFRISGRFWKKMIFVAKQAN